MRRLRWVGAIAISLSLSAATGAHATTLQPIGTFDQPVYVTSDPGNPERLFVVEREGGIELVEGGSKSTFADLSPEVECSAECEGERGLMSIALAPDFDSSGRLYVDYANSKSGTIFVEELTAEPGGKSAKGPPRQLLAIPHPGPANHNGGQLQFGPDGDLYVSTGDGGGGNDEFHNAQNLTKPLGKILRIHPNPKGVWVSPCDKRKGKPVKLLRDGRPNGSKFFDRACTARFLPRVRRPTTFTAVVPEDRKYLTGKSRHLRIRIEHRRRHPRRP